MANYDYWTIDKNVYLPPFESNKVDSHYMRGLLNGYFATIPAHLINKCKKPTNSKYSAFQLYDEIQTILFN